MIVLGIGSSIEPKEIYLKKALDEISNHPELTLKKVSKVYLTKAWGGVAKNNFLNICVEIDCNVSPFKLLSIIQNIENNLGRVRECHWADRTIDIDILLFNDENIFTDKLVIPHKYITERNFVLYPLMDISDKFVINNKSIIFWYNKVSKDIKLYKNKL